MNLSANALAVLRHRYLVRDRGGEVVESPEEMFARVASTIAAADAAYGLGAEQIARTREAFYQRMTRLEFLPNSPTMMNAGRPLGQLAACFVVPVGDTTDEIFEAVRWAALIQKTGGGTGFSFSRLRASGALVESTGGVASGPVSFMQVFDVATDVVKQGGTRRGANMGILRVDHPDILDFIALKLDPSKMVNFNLSVAMTDDFMAALSAGSTYSLRDPRTGALVRELDARRVFDLMVNAAWTVGDPGLVFIDRVNRSQPTPALGEIEATNPCGEQPLLPFESCTLGSINLAAFVGDGDLDWQRLRGAVRDGVHFLDNVIDVNQYPLEEIAAATRATRKIGLGVMGFADALIELGIPYDDARACALGRRIAEFIERESLNMSAELAEERGAFPAYEGSRWAEGAEDFERPLRNATTTTVAPTGSISIIAGCSSGIEPLYALSFERRVLDGAILRELHPAFRARAEAAGVWSEELEARVAESGGLGGLPGVPDDLARLFRTAHEVSVDAHIAVQAAFQAHVHAAVSKTINLVESATQADVAHAFELAYESGCKGVTVYRDGSRSAQVLSYGLVADEPQRAAPNGTCPECNHPTERHQGCRVCRTCGWSACG